jgi:hypothetical protein
MVSTFTPNINLEEPARGDDVGVWDTPVNSNMSVVDLVAGGIATIGLNNSPVVLSAAQFKANNITFNSTLTGSVAITFPTSFIKPYTVGNLCSGSSAFVVTLGTTAAGAQVICVPPGEFVDVFNDGINIKFRNLERVGAYWDYAGSSVPAWVSGCSVPPYLNCNGSAFSSATYPILAGILAGTTLPDSKGRYRLTLDQGAGRVSSAVAGFAPNTAQAAGGSQTVTLSASQAPANIPYTDPGHVHGLVSGTNGRPFVLFEGGGPKAVPNAGANAFDRLLDLPGGISVASGVVGITINPSGGSAFGIIGPTYVGGLTMIRAG